MAEGKAPPTDPAGDAPDPNELETWEAALPYQSSSDVEVPARLTDEEHRLWQELAAKSRFQPREK